jgi:hypothetical protein
MYFSLSLAALIGSASSAVLWDGRFNNFKASSDLGSWSWSNQVGPYQYYIVSLPVPLSCRCEVLIRAAWVGLDNLLHQPRSIIQKPRRHKQYPRRQIHLGQHLFLERADNAPDGTDPPNNSSHQQGNSVVPFQYHA